METDETNWMICYRIKGWGLVIPLSVLNAEVIYSTIPSWSVFDDSGSWQPAGDGKILQSFGLNTFIGITASGTYTDGKAYLCKTGMHINF